MMIMMVTIIRMTIMRVIMVIIIMKIMAIMIIDYSIVLSLTSKQLIPPLKISSSIPIKQIPTPISSIHDFIIRTQL